MNDISVTGTADDVHKGIRNWRVMEKTNSNVE